MSLDIGALLTLFPNKEMPPAVSGTGTANFLRGLVPYSALISAMPEALDSALIAVIEAVRADDYWGGVFQGNLTRHDGDHSRADLALCGEFSRRGLSEGAVDVAFRASGLYREKWERVDYRASTISKATKVKTAPPAVQIYSLPNSEQSRILHPNNGKVTICTSEPPVRDWTLDGLILSGKSVVLGGFGGVSKTQFAIQLSVAIAIGTSFMGKVVKPGSAMLLLGEEDGAEIKRRIGAVVRDRKFDNITIKKMESNLLAFPLIGQEIRLTKKSQGDLANSGFSDQIIETARGMEAVRLIVIDHLALCHGGDFNSREDAALTMRVVNHIAQETGAAVLVLAHTPKAALNSEESDASMVSGSTAFVDQARSALILAGMRDKESKKFKISSATERAKYVSLAVVKNNYGPAGDIIWLERKAMDGVGLLELADLQPSTPVEGAVRLETKIIDFVRGNPGQYSKSKLRDLQSGKKSEPFKASKGEVEKAIEGLLKDGRVVNRPPSADERKRFGLSAQVTQVLDIGL